MTRPRPGPPARNLFQGCSLWPALALGALLLLFVLSVGLALADKPDTTRAPKPDTAKAVHPDSSASQPKGLGILLGYVTDAETGKGLRFAEVRIQNTEYGCATDSTGFYWIINIPPGKYTVKGTALGYSTDTNKNVKIQSGLTTRSYFYIKQKEGFESAP